MQPELVKVLAETANGDMQRYVFGPRGILAQEDSAGHWTWTVQDALGSVRVDVNDDLAVQATQHYGSYGVPFGAQGSFGLPFGFTGEMTDANGLVYLRARYYAPELGVFPSLDPVENLNRYQYVGANPINFVDRSGMDQQIADDRLCPPGMDFIPPASCGYAGGNWPPVPMSEAWSDFWKTYAGEAILGQRTEWWNPFDDLCLGDLALLVFIAEPSPAGELATGYKALRTLGRVLPWLVATGVAVYAFTSEDPENKYRCGDNGISLFRSMRKSPDGYPETGNTRRTLGVRVDPQDPDLPVITIERIEHVEPNTGGMSVAPFTPYNLPIFRRPPEFGGQGQDPVWCIAGYNIMGELQFRLDSDVHGIIEPSRVMALIEYQSALWATRTQWAEVKKR